MRLEVQITSTKFNKNPKGRLVPECKGGATNLKLGGGAQCIGRWGGVQYNENIKI